MCCPIGCLCSSTSWPSGVVTFLLQKDWILWNFFQVPFLVAGLLPQLVLLLAVCPLSHLVLLLVVWLLLQLVLLLVWLLLQLVEVA